LTGVTLFLNKIENFWLLEGIIDYRDYNSLSCDYQEIKAEEEWWESLEWDYQDTFWTSPLYALPKCAKQINHIVPVSKTTNVYMLILPIQSSCKIVLV
jgi:hypothetical protein